MGAARRAQRRLRNVDDLVDDGIAKLNIASMVDAIEVKLATRHDIWWQLPVREQRSPYCLLSAAAAAAAVVAT